MEKISGALIKERILENNNDNDIPSEEMKTAYSSVKIKISPLSFSQVQMWIIDRMQPGNHAYNLPVGFRIRGTLNVELIEKSINEIIRRHEILRTTFALVNDQPMQIVHPEFSAMITIINLENLNQEERGTSLKKLVYEEAVRAFDLSSLPLIRATLIKIGSDENILLLNMHHIISDGWSLGIIFHELSILYNSYISPNKPDLPDLQVQYSDYCIWQKDRNWKPTYENQLTYWIKQLQGELAYPELPVDKKRPSVQSLNGSNEFFFLSNILVQKIQSVGIKRGCSFYMTIMAALQAFLYKYSCGEEIIIGTPVSNRPRKEDENLIGNYVNMLAIRTNLGDDPDFTTLLRRVQKIIIEALTNRDLPFEEIVERLKIRRDPGRNPVFQVMLQILPKYSFEIPGLEISNYNFDLGYSQVDLSFHFYQVNEGYQCRIEYNTDLFEAGTIKRMASNFQNFLNEIVENVDNKISDIPFLSSEEKSLIVDEWNNTKLVFAEDSSLIDLFESTVSEKGNNSALQFGETILSYKELNSRANKLANYLLKSGNVKPGMLVGVCLERSVDMVVSLLGILKTGAAYLPLDPTFPVERLSFIVKDAGISFLISEENLIGIFPDFTGKILCIDIEWEKIKTGSSENLNISIDSSNLAYSIYTSGSSGKPKGVLIEHRSVVNFLTSMKNAPGIEEKDVLLSVTTISFDISVLEIFLPLISGAKVVLAGKKDIVDGNLLNHLIKKSNATIMQATPSTWKLLLEGGWTKTTGLKMLCGGEALSRDLANKMLERGKELWNMYGPTETTVWSSVKRIEAGEEPVLIGPPIANTQFYVVNQNLQLLPIGVSGELVIGGSGLARGYLNRQELNDEKFVNNTILNDGSRLYKTGDHVRALPSGDIEFLSRTDFQVKIRGYRIEPGEIESVLCLHESIKEAVVTAKQNKNLEKQLVAYIIISNIKDFKLNELRSFLKLKLPEYMVPSVFVKMESFPITPNSKIDRKALPEPDSGRIDTGLTRILPGNEIEFKLAKIWERILGAQNIGVTDNFFDLGGHSLLAVQMFSELEKDLQIKLPLVTLFEHQNISELAQVISSGNWKQKWSSLIRVKEGSGTPLFLIHGAEGNILVYKDLANHLLNDNPFFAIQSKGLNGLDEVITSIEEMASYYIKEIKKVQPIGPYILGGYCLGGTIALEMAQQLTRQGDEVKNVFLIETYNICINDNQISNKMTFTDKLENIKFHIYNMKKLNRDGKKKFMANKSEIVKRRIISNLKALVKLVGINIKDTNETIKATHRIREINDNAQREYKPKAYYGKIVLLKTKVNYSSGPDSTFGWDKLLKGDFKIYNLDIAPRGMLYEPFVKETASIILKEM